jgi:protein-tyrosine phosphatase
MVNLSQNKPVSFFANIATEQGKIQPYDKIKVISITDYGLKKIFEKDTNDVLTMVFDDAEPSNINYEVPEGSNLMTPHQAEKIIDYLETLHSSDERILLLVNCKHGICRSGAIVDFVGCMCGLGYWNTKNRNPTIVPNHWVKYLLYQEHFKRKFNK